MKNHDYQRRANLNLENLEDRSVPAVVDAFVSGSTLIVKCDNTPTDAILQRLPSGGYVGKDLTTGDQLEWAPGEFSEVKFIGGAANDRLRTINVSVPMEIWGNGGNNTLQGGNARDFIYGGNGHDHLDGKGGDDIIHGGTGNDKIWGGSGRDKLFGAGGNDYIYGDSGNDELYGSSGNDYLHGGFGNDYMNGGGQYNGFNGPVNDILDGSGDGGARDMMFGDDENAPELQGRRGRDIFYIDAADVIRDYRPQIFEQDAFFRRA